MSQAPVDKKLPSARIHADSSVKIGQGQVNSSHVEVRRSPVIVGLGIARIKADGHLEIGQGLLKPPCFGVGYAPVVVGESRGGIEGDGPVIIGYGCLILSFVSIDGAPVVISPGIAMIEGDSLGVSLDGTVEIAAVGEVIALFEPLDSGESLFISGDGRLDSFTLPFTPRGGELLFEFFILPQGFVVIIADLL